MKNDIRLIDANALKRAFATDMRIINFDGTRMGAGGFLVQRYQVVGLIDEAPTIDAVPVVYGQWSEEYTERYVCTVCGKWFFIDSGDGNMNYCPNCGAKMVN